MDKTELVVAHKPHGGRFQPGNQLNQGRRPGSLNRTSAELKNAVLSALDAAGGAQWLQSLATSPDPEDKKLFVALLIKCLPSQTSTDVAVATSEFTIRWASPSD